MLPIPGGSVVIGEFIQNFYNIKKGGGYIIVTRDEGIVFKIVENYLPEKRSLLLTSLNKAFKPYELRITELQEAWKFVCYLNTEIPEPETDIQKVLQTVNEMKIEIKNLRKK